MFQVTDIHDTEFSLIHINLYLLICTRYIFMDTADFLLPSCEIGGSIVVQNSNGGQ